MANNFDLGQQITHSLRYATRLVTRSYTPAWCRRHANTQLLFPFTAQQPTTDCRVVAGVLQNVSKPCRSCTRKTIKVFSSCGGHRQQHSAAPQHFAQYPTVAVWSGQVVNTKQEYNIVSGALQQTSTSRLDATASTKKIYKPDSNHSPVARTRENKFHRRSA